MFDTKSFPVYVNSIRKGAHKTLHLILNRAIFFENISKCEVIETFVAVDEVY